MPRLKYRKRPNVKNCPRCGLKGGLMYCRRCHGPRSSTHVKNMIAWSWGQKQLMKDE